MPNLSRRRFLAGAAATASFAQQTPPPTVETHLHLFSDRPELFPYHANATYRPEPAPLGDYLGYAPLAGISNVIIVHPEPYQDDHSYLEFCFQNEPSEMFFKGTCLFDPIRGDTPDRMAALVERNPDRIVALRVHCNRKRDEPPTQNGPIRDRDLSDRMVRQTILAAHRLGLAVQFHIIPAHAAQVHYLAAQFPETVFLIDHLARSGFGTPAEFAQVMEMANLPNVHMKFSGVRYSSRQDHPYRDTRALVRDVYDAFGPDRILWGGLGQSIEEFRLNEQVFNESFAFTDRAGRNRIRGGNALRLFWS